MKSTRKETSILTFVIICAIVNECIVSMANGARAIRRHPSHKYDAQAFNSPQRTIVSVPAASRYVPRRVMPPGYRYPVPSEVSSLRSEATNVMPQRASLDITSDRSSFSNQMAVNLDGSVTTGQMGFVPMVEHVAAPEEAILVQNSQMTPSSNISTQRPVFTSTEIVTESTVVPMSSLQMGRGKPTMEILSVEDDVNRDRNNITNNEMDSLQMLQASAANSDNDSRLFHHHVPQIEKIDVACGKETMTIRVTFDEEFNGVIYAKGHYSDPKCKFVNENSGAKMYQFDMTVGECGVSFIDSGLSSGGEAFVEGILVAILEPGVQEAWDTSRRIRCLWEGNIDQTVTFPLSIDMLDSQTLTFSGDTVSASLEIQSGRGPRAPSAKGLVSVGELLTAVVTVQGDTAFDLLVKNCVATDGTPENRINLSDSQGCAIKPKLMGGWRKQRSNKSTAAYSYLSAFKFPDVMDLFLECTVSLCKNDCDECPTYHELHVPGFEDSSENSGEIPSPSLIRKNQIDDLNIKEEYVTDSPITVEAPLGSRIVKRSVSRRTMESSFDESRENASLSEPLKLRRMLHVISSDDLPSQLTLLTKQEKAELQRGEQYAPLGSSYGWTNRGACVSMMGLGVSVVATMLLMFFLFAAFRFMTNQRRYDHQLGYKF